MSLLSNRRVTESNNWHGRLLQRAQASGLATRVPAKSEQRSWRVRVAFEARGQAERVCVRQLLLSCLWQRCCNQASRGRLPATPPLHTCKGRGGCMKE